MSKITELGSGALTATDQIIIELVEADEIPDAPILAENTHSDITVLSTGAPESTGT